MFSYTRNAQHELIDTRKLCFSFYVFGALHFGRLNSRICSNEIFKLICEYKCTYLPSYLYLLVFVRSILRNNEICIKNTLTEDT